MSISGGKLISSEDSTQRGRSSKMSNCSGALVGTSAPTSEYSPTVQCVKLDLSNRNAYKTDLQHDYKTEVCLKRADPNRNVDFARDSEANVAALASGEDVDKLSQNNEDRAALTPDSTTSQLDLKHSFDCGDDVFVHHKDGRYYLGTVIAVDVSGDRWLVRFGDNTEKWSSARELRPLASPSGNDTPAMCVVCKFSKGNNNEIFACNCCNRGYHSSCHDPPISNLVRGKVWNCKRCDDQKLNKATISKSRSLRRTDTVKNKQKSSTSLPYDLNYLNWDAEHRTNLEKTYCYCGTNGDWYIHMIQCARCKQWFHSDCILCLKFPVYTGDRFYVFVCSLCNFGTEFLRRLEMKWVDLVHLVLFNLTVYHNKKYFDLDTIIIPYIKDNWYALQLPQEMSRISSEDRREVILSALCNNGIRFKCGREIKKRTTIWGLRNRTPPLPPSPPTAPLPRGPLTDQALSGHWGRLSFVAYPQDASFMQESTNRRMIVSPDSHWKSVMKGTKFLNSSSSDVESPRSTPSPMHQEISSGYQINNEFSSRPGYSNQKSNDETFESDYVLNSVTLGDDRNISNQFNQKNYKFYSLDYHESGFVKKSLPFPKTSLLKRQKNESSKQRSKRRKSLMNYDSDENRMKRKLRKTLMKPKHKSFKSSSKGSLLDEESSFTSTDHDGVSKDSSVVFDSRGNDILPLTPPTSMSAPPTPPTTVIPNSNSNSSDVSTEYQLSHSLFSKDSVNFDSDVEQTDFKRKCEEVRKFKSPDKVIENHICIEETNNLNSSYNLKTAAMNLEISKLSTKNIIEHSKIMSLHHMNTDVPYRKTISSKPENDSSGDDTSSRGTLDSIIPPPVNFQGVNNPFHNVSNVTSEKNKFNSTSNFITNKLFNRNNITKLSINYNSNKNCVSNKYPRISLPVNLNPVIRPGVKLLKRQLSEKDLIIGPNGEVKRRRHRRTKISNISQNKFNNSKHGLNERQKSLRSSLCQEDARINDFTGNDLNSQLPGAGVSRCLRQRQEKNYFDGRRGSNSSNNTNSSQVIGQNSFTNIQNKMDGHMNSQRLRNVSNSQSNNSCVNDQWNTLDDIQDLKSSVHSYFGTANRIETGEKFSFTGRRITDAGKLQYLIEWEGHGS